MRIVGLHNGRKSNLAQVLVNPATLRMSGALVPTMSEHIKTFRLRSKEVG